MRTHTPYRSPWRAVLAAAATVAALVAVVLTAFVWPALNSEPREVPLAVAAPPPVTEQIEQGLAQVGENAFDIEPVADRSVAVSAIQEREVYGAIVAGPDGAEMLTASAASPAVSQLLTDVSGHLGDGEVPVAVTDVAPLPDEDPRGVALTAGALPLVIAGIATGGLMAVRLTGRVRRFGGVLAGAGLVGLAVVAILQLWFGALEGNYWANSGVAALTVAAIAAAALGLYHVIGNAGLVLTAAIMVLLGNPLSGLASAPEMLPSGLGALGQLLPPGAGGSALRSVAFFDGSGSAGPLLALAVWVVLGLVLLAVPVRCTRRTAVSEAAARPERDGEPGSLESHRGDRSGGMVASE